MSEAIGTKTFVIRELTDKEILSGQVNDCKYAMVLLSVAALCLALVGVGTFFLAENAQVGVMLVSKILMMVGFTASATFMASSVLVDKFFNECL